MAISQTTQFWSVGQSAKFLGVSASQVRLLVANGELTGFVMPSGHRRLSVASVKAYAAGSTPDDLAAYGNEQGKAVVGYCRTSSTSQLESLQRQEGRLSATIADREAIAADAVSIRKECCSSFGERKVLNQLILDVINGKVKKIYLEHWNRLSRTMALNKMIEFLAETYGVEIVALDREESPDELANNLQELLDFVQVLSCRQAAQKSKLVTVVHLPTATVSRIAELSNTGYTQREIAKIIDSEGHKTTNGKPISRSKIRQYILLNGTAKTIVGIDKTEQTNLHKLLTQWTTDHVIPSEGSRLTVKQIAPAFNAWMESQGKATVRPTVVGKWLTQVAKMPNKMVAGYRYFLNIAIA
jgi:predicted site-specific integrase-resolvase